MYKIVKKAAYKLPSHFTEPYRLLRFLIRIDILKVVRKVIEMLNRKYLFEDKDSNEIVLQGMLKSVKDMAYKSSQW